MAILPFIDELFPEDISYGSRGGPAFKTDIFTASSGQEQRNVLFSQSRAKYEVSYGIKSKQDMDLVLKFFYIMRGRATAFRFKDWSDFTLVNEKIGVGNGTQTVYQLTKTYALGAQTYVRDIKKIKAASLTVKTVNGVVETPVVGFTVDINTGIVTLPSAPTTGHKVVVNCTEFHVPVRFDVDEMPLTLEAFEVESWDGISLIEVKVA